jgi:hypothetical protein
VTTVWGVAIRVAGVWLLLAALFVVARGYAYWRHRRCTLCALGDGRASCRAGAAPESWRIVKTAAAVPTDAGLVEPGEVSS